MTDSEYRYIVEKYGLHNYRLYDGTNEAEAVATWSKAISEGIDYVSLEALKPARAAGTNERHP